tara:strand:+ start:460 stop:810 length:351 start_codon:yes stop_codon:yes gene_type:complete
MSTPVDVSPCFDVISDALIRVNEIRAAHQHARIDCLPSGFHEGDTCPIAVALTVGDMRATVHGSEHGLSEVEVHIRREYTDGISREETHHYTGEAAIGQFVERFDGGDLHEYLYSE